MHTFALVILALIVLLLYYRESFIAQYDMMVNRAVNPIYVNYHGRERDESGRDYFDYLLKHEIASKYIVDV